MPFNTMSFYIVFVAFLAIYAVLRSTSRVLMLLYVTLFSLAFNHLANPGMGLLLPLTAFISWSLTRHMNQCKGHLRTSWMWFIIALQLAPLVYFKYSGYCFDGLAALFGHSSHLAKAVMPIGISFYTFQAISNTVDVYRRKFRLKMDFLEYLFYLSFFPLLFSGPITRSAHLLPQMRDPRPISKEMLYSGLFLVMTGIVKKCVIADYIGQYSTWAFDNPQMYNGFELLMAVIGYSMQIYCDFSGYSDIAIGIASMMGFQLRQNFNFPYQAINPTEFWHRWHISLSTWFRDYVYISLGGSRKGRARTYANLFITMLLAGLWHGSSIMYLIWGTLHGAGLVVHKYFRQLWLEGISNRWYTIVVSWLAFQTFMMLTWIVFRSDTPTIATHIITRIFTHFTPSCIPEFLSTRHLWVVVLVASFLLHGICERDYYRLQKLYISLPWAVKFILLLCIVQLAVEFSTSDVQPFIYYKY